MTAPTPTRMWHADAKPEALPPVVLVSSRDGAPVPRVAGAVRLVDAAEAAGWTARQTFALADVPEAHYDNGNLRKSAHQVASVAVRLARGAQHAWATWHNENGAGWRFDAAYIGLTRYGWTGDRSIRRAVSADAAPNLAPAALDEAGTTHNPGRPRAARDLLLGGTCA